MAQENVALARVPGLTGRALPRGDVKVVVEVGSAMRASFMKRSYQAQENASIVEVRVWEMVVSSDDGWESLEILEGGRALAQAFGIMLHICSTSSILVSEVDGAGLVNGTNTVMHEHLVDFCFPCTDNLDDDFDSGSNFVSVVG